MRLILGGQKLATIRVDFGQFNMCGMLWYLHKDHLFWIFGSKLVGEVPWTSHLMLNWFSKIPGKMLNFVKKGDWLIYTPCPESTIHFRNPTVFQPGHVYHLIFSWNIIVFTGKLETIPVNEDEYEKGHHSLIAAPGKLARACVICGTRMRYFSYLNNCALLLKNQ